MEGALHGNKRPVAITNSDVLQSTAALSIVAMPERCGVLRLEALPVARLMAASPLPHELRVFGGVFSGGDAQS